DQARHERLPARRVLRPNRQAGEPVEKGLLVAEIDLDHRRSDGRIVEGADGDFDLLLRRALDLLISQRRAAPGAETALDPVGTGEVLRLSARPDDIETRNQRTEKASERLLAHAAMADRGTTQPADAETHGAALAAAAEGRLTRGHDTPPRCCCRPGR